MNNSKEEYDPIAEAYKESKKLSFRKYIEEFTLFKILKDIEGKHVLDLACGEGFYTRKLKSLGAKSTLGVDISSEMIALAEQQESENPIGCTYLHTNVAELSFNSEFDIVSAMYLLNYASSEKQLLDFCSVAFNALKKGGVFAGFNDNIASNPNLAPPFTKYGFQKSTPDHQKEGDIIQYTITNEDGSTFSINNFFLKPETYESIFKKTGFHSFSWEGPFLDPTQQENPFWNDFMKYKPMIGFKAIK